MRAADRPWMFGALLLACAPALAADRIFRHAFEDPVDCVATPSHPECPTFTIAAPTITVPPGVASSTCFYFNAPNTATRGIRRIASTFSGAQYIALHATYATGSNTPAARQPAGTVSNQDCGNEFGSNGTDAYRIYQAHAESQALDTPADDGTGVPVAIEWQANQPLFLQVVAPNPTASPIEAQVTLGVDALPAGQPYTRTETLFTYNTQINLPPNSAGTATATCNVPAGVVFWHFTTQTHRFATSATLQSFPALETFVISTDWEAPAIQENLAPPFYAFGAGQQLRYACNYVNNSNFVVTAGPDEFSDENCVGIAYFFPATRPRICVNNILVP